MLTQKNVRESLIEMEYEKEYGKLKNEQNYWKPTEGLHKVTFLQELEEPVKRTMMVEGQSKEIMQSDVRIDVAGHVCTWSITKAEGKNSVWGQLLYYAANVKSLMGKTITVLVQGTGKTRKYIIQESLELKSKQQKL